MFAAGWVLAVRLFEVHYALSLIGTMLIAVAVIRLFIIFHDCGHGSFSFAPAQRSRRDDGRRARLHAVPALELRPRPAPRDVVGPRPSRVRRRVDDDGRGVPLGIAVPAQVLPDLPLDLDHVHARTGAQVRVSPTDGRPARDDTAADHAIGVRHERGHRRVRRHDGRARRAAALRGRAGADPRDRRLGCNLVVLRAALLRGRVLVAPQAMALRRCGDAGQFAPAPRPGVAVRLRQHRVPPPPPSGCPDPELQPSPLRAEHPELQAEHSFTLRESFAARHLKLWDEPAARYVGYEAAGR